MTASTLVSATCSSRRRPLSATATVLAAVVGLVWAAPSGARGTYQSPQAFVAEAFGGRPPAPQTLWVTDAVQAEVTGILGHPLPARRVRYWAQAGRSAWVLEEIGKEEPITTGIIVDRDRIETIKVLIYRESRGDEVRHAFFTDQFRGAGLTPARTLDRDIDGISGATLSVRALTRLARVALYLHRAAGIAP